MSKNMLFFLKNKENLEKTPQNILVSEYEIMTDSYPTGDFKYGPYEIMIWEFGKLKEGEEKKLCLRIKEDISDDNKENDKNGIEKKEVLYHGGYISDEIITFASLLTLSTIIPSLIWISFFSPSISFNGSYNKPFLIIKFFIILFL